MKSLLLLTVTCLSMVISVPLFALEPWQYVPSAAVCATSLDATLGGTLDDYTDAVAMLNGVIYKNPKEIITRARIEGKDIPVKVAAPFSVSSLTITTDGSLTSACALVTHIDKKQQ